MIQLRGSPEYKAIVEKLADLDGTSVAAMVDRAIRRYARELGFTEPIPRR